MPTPMKRILALALALVAALSLTACIGEREPAETEPSTEATAPDTTASDTRMEATKPETEPAVDDLPALGTEVGDRCYAYELERCGNAEGVYSITENLGKVTVLNFWGVWCSPCKNELPHFDSVASEYADDVTVVAVHSYQSQTYDGQTYEEYMAENYADSSIIFCIDQPGELYYSMVGGYSSYPTTLILDRNGVITHIYRAAIDEATLRASVAEAMG